ncbi:MAG: hypothetical protein AB2A00_02695 [Myxococcota bacterium]
MSLALTLWAALLVAQTGAAETAEPVDTPALPAAEAAPLPEEPPIPEERPTPPPGSEPVAPPVVEPAPQPSPPVAPAAPPVVDPTPHPAPPVVEQPPRPVADPTARVVENRPDIGPLRSQPWATGLAAALGVWMLVAPVPLLVCLAIAGAAMAGVVLNTQVVRTSPWIAALPSTFLLASLAMVPLALSGGVAWAVASGMTALGLAVPPSLDVAPEDSEGSVVERLSSRTSIPALERALLGRWPGFNAPNRLRAMVAGFALASAGLALMVAHAVAAVALVAAVTAVIVVGAVLAVVAVVMLAKDSRSDPPDPPSRTHDDDPPSAHIYVESPWVPWWWLFIGPPPPSTTSAHTKAAPASADSRNLEKWFMSLAMTSCGLLPADVGVRMLFRGLRAMGGDDEVDRVEEKAE